MFKLGAPIIKERERAGQQSRYTLLIVTPAWLAGPWQEFDELLITTYGHYSCSHPH